MNTKQNSFKSYVYRIKQVFRFDQREKITELRGHIRHLENQIQKLEKQDQIKERRLNVLSDSNNGEVISNQVKDIYIPKSSKFCFLSSTQKEFDLLVKTRVRKKYKSITSSIDSVKEEDRQLQIGDSFVRTLYLADLPNIITLNPVYKLLHLPIPLNLVYHIQGTSRGNMLSAAKRRLAVLEAEQNDRIKKGKNRDMDLDKEIEEVNHLTQDLVYDKERTFLVSLYPQVSSESREELIKFSKTLEHEMRDVECTFNTYSFGQLQAFQSTLPLAKDVIKKDFLLHTQGVVNLLPFLSRRFNDESGILLGMSRVNNSLVLVDLFKARNANINIFGTSGSGKSVTAKLLISRLLLREVQSIIIDPEGEYVSITEAFAGQVIRFSQQFGFNIFQIPASGSINNHIATLKTFFRFFIQNNRYDSALLDKILVELYQNNPQPRLKDLQSACEAYRAPFTQDIEMLLTGSMSGIFDSEHELEIHSDIVCFDLSEIASDEIKVPAMFLISSFINSLIDSKDRRRMIFIDEAHKLLANRETVSFYINLVKTARKRKAGIVTITQNPEDFREDNGAKTIITQAETSFILKQAYSSIQYIIDKKVFPLTDQELQDIPMLGIGEALFIREKEHILIDVYPFESEEELVFT